MKIKLFSALTAVLFLMLLTSFTCKQVGSKNNNSQSSLAINPCIESQATSNKASIFSQSNIYSTAKANIKNAFNRDSLEHAISFGKDVNGNNITSAMSIGSGHSSGIETVANMFADIHNHSKETPPSSGDLYGFINMATEYRLYETRYIVTANGFVYAFVIIDLQTACNFVIKYPKVSNPGYQPGFPDSLIDEFNELKGVYAASDEMAMAFILEKYNVGVALLKQDNHGSFKRLNTKEITYSNGLKKYVANNCQ